MSAAFVAAMARLARLPDSRCSEPWEWPGHSAWPLQVRDALYRSLEEELAAVAAQPAPPSEAGRLLAVGQRAWGELRGLLVGVPDAALDRAPSAQGLWPSPVGAVAGEPAAWGLDWTLRDALGHLLLSGRRDREALEYALRRSGSEPLTLQPSAALGEAEEAGGAGTWIDRLAAERAVGAELASATSDQLHRPTLWAGYQVDVRFSMLRLAGQLVEHTVQAERILAGTGWEPGEAHLIVRRISGARGAHELFTEGETLGRLDEVHADRAASLCGS
ncbi:MAG: hypothetical protein M3075_14165 [Candidatus Dormibacteraeota bacterium]|nr:hypothetical protein [Candidatus Dormibacteraeota bacterium]